MSPRNTGRGWGPAHFPWITIVVAVALAAGVVLDARREDRGGPASPAVDDSRAQGVGREDAGRVARRALLAAPATPASAVLAAPVVEHAGAPAATTPVAARTVGLR